MLSSLAHGVMADGHFFANKIASEIKWTLTCIFSAGTSNFWPGSICIDSLNSHLHDESTG